MTRPLVLASLLLVLAATSVRSDEPASKPPRAPVKLEKLGGQTHPISTKVPEAQAYFDQGMILTFGFNHAAAIDAFREAARLDPECAMCFWGVALALGPNINAPMGPEAAVEAYAALQEAERLAPGKPEIERDYIAALAPRYAVEPPEDRSALDAAYAEAMGELHGKYPDDVDAATLYAEALMDLYPWDYWKADGKPRKHTEEIVSVLEGVMQRAPQHVGANHYYIHAVEEFFPEKGEAAADRLAPVAPDAGHLVHMPSHIYWRVGRYQDAAQVNRNAAAADEQFFAWCRPGAFYRAAYYPHNIHFLWAATSVEGQSEAALTAARKLESKTRDGMDAMPFLEEFVSIPTLTLARFGRWDPLLAMPRPDANRVYLSGIWHYGRGLARVRTGELEQAAAELQALRAAAATEQADLLLLAGGTSTARAMLGIGEAHLEGELAAARGDTNAAIQALQLAVERQDALVYMEPPPWYFPTRQALGAALLDAGRPAEAEKVYREDLDKNPRNGWSLYGLAKSLEVQGKPDEAKLAYEGHRNAFARADVELEASRF